MAAPQCAAQILFPGLQPGMELSVLPQGSLFRPESFLPVGRALLRRLSARRRAYPRQSAPSPPGLARFFPATARGIFSSSGEIPLVGSPRLPRKGRLFYALLPFVPAATFCRIVES